MVSYPITFSAISAGTTRRRQLQIPRLQNLPATTQAPYGAGLVAKNPSVGDLFRCPPERFVHRRRKARGRWWTSVLVVTTSRSSGPLSALFITSVSRRHPNHCHVM